MQMYQCWPVAVGAVMVVTGPVGLTYNIETTTRIAIYDTHYINSVSALQALMWNVFMVLYQIYLFYIQLYSPRVIAELSKNIKIITTNTKCTVHHYDDSLS